MGNTIHSSSVNLRLYNEPISFHDTSGITAKPSLLADGCTIFSEISKSSIHIDSVVIYSSSSILYYGAFINFDILLTAIVPASLHRAYKSAAT